MSRNFFLLVLLFVGFVGQCQITSGKGCEATTNVEVLFDSTFKQLTDNPHVVIQCGPCHFLRAADSSYQILGFTMKSELITGEIKERDVSGNFLINNAYAHTDLFFLKKGTYIYFYCIKAQKQGQVYYLKPFSILRD